MEIGVAHATAAGETVCGDAHRVIDRGERVLVCVADGLGHGPAAATAAIAACEYCERYADLSIDSLFLGIDRALATLRGAAVSITEVVPATRSVRFAGVGNVEGRAIGATRFSPLTRPGIIGRHPKPPPVFDAVLEPGDAFVIFTDGISSRHEFDAPAGAAASAIASGIVRGHHRTHDDALCVVIRMPPRRPR